MKMVSKSSHIVRGLAFAAIAGTLASTASAGLPASTPTYAVTPLTAAGATDLYVVGVNNANLAVGSVFDAAGVEQPYFWKNGVPTQLGGVGALGGRALGVNASGQIVGQAYEDGANHAMLWQPDGTPVNLGTLGGSFGFATAINDNGVVVGSSYVGNKQHAFVWTTTDGMVDYGSSSPNDFNYHAGWNAISNTGTLAGTNYRLFSPFHASTGQLGTVAVVDVSPPAQYSNGMALGVNDAGVIVGYQNVGGRGSPVPSIFNADGTVTPLDTNPFALGEGWAEDINNSGVVVGRAFGPDADDNFQQLGFVRIEGQLVNLLDLVPADSGWTQFFSASSINDNGSMVGVGIYNGEVTGFIMTVVPEPTTIGAVAIAAVLIRRRR